MSETENKSSLDEVRRAWRRGLIGAPTASHLVISRAIAQSAEYGNGVTVRDLVFGVVASTALSVLLTVSLSSYSSNSETSDLSSYLMQDQITEVING